MKPLVSGPEVKRYEEPETSIYLLFPYTPDARGAMRLISADDMAMRFPRAWAYLHQWRNELTKEGTDREKDWWGYVYRKNLDKQHLSKLLVAQTVPGMRVSADYSGRHYLDNVRVNGILPASGVDPSFLLGALNGPIADFVFRRIGKPKQGGWFEANRQFIAPLPIPNASTQSRADIAALARRLQERWTDRRTLLSEADDRLSVLARARHPARWLWPDLPSLPEIIKRAPKGLPLAVDRRRWAEERLDELEAGRVEALQAALDRGGRREVRFQGGELRLYVSGAIVLDKIYLDESPGPLTEAYWRWLLLSGPAREAKRFAADLRCPPAPSDAPAAAQFLDRVAALADEVAAIEADERAMNETLYQLYRLTPEERNLVENERGRRNAALASG